MTIAVTPSESDILKALGDFLVASLPAGTGVFQGYDNRVPEPAAANFVVMLPIMRQRLETNIDSYFDVSFVGSISGTTLTVTHVDFGTILLGAQLFGVNVVAGTIIAALGSGTGGVGTYTLSANNGTLTPATLATGAESILQPINLTVQCDVHGPASADNAQRATTLFRDLWAADFFAAISADIAPLYADDPRLIPFLNDSQQVENRWVASFSIQANQSVINLPTQFADELEVTLINVEATYPAT